MLCLLFRRARGADISIDFIYDNLSGGNWIDVEGYGYGWQPDLAVSDPNWRPYSDGYWAYTDYGWTWISYEDFGWAAYHYGRWANLADYGWVWFPGEDLDWGPAWVSWRTGGDYIGWAPLPPRGPEVVYEGQPIGTNVDVTFDIGPEYYNFCDVRFIGEPVLRDRILPPVQNVTYITNTVNVTNIYVQNNTVYNYGPDYTVVNRYSSRPIQRLAIERQTAGDLSDAVKSGTLTKVQGNKLLVAAPQKLAKAPPTAKPPAVKAKVAQPKIEHGWKGVPNKSELEQKIKAENPKNIPPPTRAAAREAGSPAPAPGTSPATAEGGPAGTPGPRGRAGRVVPGATQARSLGGSPSPVERGKGRPGARPQPGATAMPAEGARRVSPSPAEAGRPGGRGHAGITPPPSGAREGLSPTPFERGKQSERSPEPGAAGGQHGAAKATPHSSFQGGPPQPEHGHSPTGQRGEEQGPGQGEQNPPQGQADSTYSDSARRRLWPQVNTSNAAVVSRPDFIKQLLRHLMADLQVKHAARENECRAPMVSRRATTTAPAAAQHGGAPASADHGQGHGQPEGGKKKAPKETPPPQPR